MAGPYNIDESLAPEDPDYYPWHEDVGAAVNDLHTRVAAVESATGDASTTAKGVVELATSAETVTGTDSSRAVTPAGLASTRGRYVGVNAQTGTTYTLVLSDQGKFITLTNASPITLTVPPNSSVAFPVGAQVDLAAMGDGMVTITPGSGVTVKGRPSLVTREKEVAVTLIKLATNEWLAVGALADV